MPTISHKFINHIQRPNTEILILGTFNPDIPTGPDFFYGRPRNYLWKLLPGCWGLESLKEATLPEKKEFMAKFRIDFIDLIQSVNVPEDEAANVDDEYIDSRMEAWNDVIALIDTLMKLKAVYFARKTFKGIPNMAARVKAIKNHCHQKGIRFCLLETPARFANAAKQQMWIDTVIEQNTCLNAWYINSYSA